MVMPQFSLTLTLHGRVGGDNCGVLSWEEEEGETAPAEPSVRRLCCAGAAWTAGTGCCLPARAAGGAWS